MTRKSFRLWLAPLLLGPACALALEIGEIQVNSALNQLFDAKIPLPTLAPEELSKVSVKLAPVPIFKEFGLERTSSLANLVFSIEYNAEGQVYVKVISTKPIQEPSLGLLVEFGWPRGKTFREFTVFLDPVRRLAKQPTDRTKTVLEAPASPMAGPDLAPVPETMPEPDLASVREPVPVAAVAVPGPVDMPDEPTLPVEAPPPARIWRPGESYGPVVSGEGLWGIALKVRPDPGISREHMMEALFEANPQAFSKAGASGLKIGAMLRIPSWREIANFTGSPVARRLAEAEQPTTSEGVDHARSAAAPVPAEPARVVASVPQAFPLEPSVVPDPVAVVASPRPPPEPAPTTPEPAPAAAPEPAPAAPEPKVSEPVVESTVLGQESSPQILEPVSVTPLLLLAVSEMMASVTEISTTAISEQVVSPIPPADLIPLEPIEEITALTESPALVPSELGSPVPVVEPTEPPATPPAEPPPEPPATVAAEPPPEPPATVAAEPLVVGSPEPPEPAVYKGGDRYGPVSNNERLWDIAAKVSPDPAISKDLMMKALFAVNPQAFSKAKMDSLKIGVMLRVPTLQEIVEHTGSKVAKQLLQQQQDSPTRLVEPEPKPVLESALPVAPISAEPPETSQPGVAGPAAKPTPVVEAQPDSAAAPADAEPAELAEPASTDAAPAPIESPLPAPIGETAVSE